MFYVRSSCTISISPCIWTWPPTIMQLIETVCLKIVAKRCGITSAVRWVDMSRWWACSPLCRLCRNLQQLVKPFVINNCLDVNELTRWHGFKTTSSSAIFTEFLCSVIISVYFLEKKKRYLQLEIVKYYNRTMIIVWSKLRLYISGFFLYLYVHYSYQEDLLKKYCDIFVTV